MMEFEDLLGRARAREDEEATVANEEKGDGITEAQRDALRAIGRKGGKNAAAKLGREHYQRIGKMGGIANRAKHGREHYERIGKMGGARVREICAAARAAAAAGKNGGDGEG